MKKLVLIFALIMCFVLCSAALSSCGINAGDTTTAGPSTAATPTTEPATTATPTATPATTAEPATTATQTATTDGPATTAEPTCAHVWDEGTVTDRGNCAEGIEGTILYVCTLCGETKTETEMMHTWNDGRVLESATCSSEGRILYTCTVCSTGRKTEKIPVLSDHRWSAGSERIITPPTATEDGVTEKVCQDCKKVGQFTITYADYVTQVRAAREQARSFSDTSAFGSGSITASFSGSYSAPSVSPTAGQHPRVLFNQNDVANVRATVYDERNAAAVKLFRDALKSPTDGLLGAARAQSEPSGTHNFSQSKLNNIQMLALDYQMTGNAISGYRAIYAMKNVLLTMDYQSMGDVTRYYGYTMYIAACVYDWCHDLMNDTDKNQIVLGVQKRICEAGMEAGFPPSGNTAISGHGCEFGILRDYLSFAIAIYDEYPGWWNYIAGRFYQEYAPVRNYYYEAGMVPQGVSLYAQTRYGADIYSAWLIKAATGTLPYDASDMKQVARSIFSHELPGTYNGRYYLGFNTGDDHAPDGSFINYSHIALISSYLFDDATMRAELEYYKTNCSTFSYGSVIADAGVGEYLICSSNGVQAASDRHEGMDLILYNGGWLGQIIARNSWNSDQAAVLMKVGVRTTGNHDHCDSGQFQIFYKAILAGDTGAYVKYGEAHHYYYHQATVAHNSLLIYNPSLATTENGYYSGGQRFLKMGEIGVPFSDWLSDSKYQTGEVAGVSVGYADPDETTPTYAYIAGDLTSAYSSSTVSEVTRRMLTVYDTGRDDVPMYFFVFDSITSKNGSYKKTFLLHTPTEPQIDGKTVTVVNGGGKLVLQNVIGNNIAITPVGNTVDGEGNVVQKNYWVNKNGADSYVQLDNSYNRDDEYWGRVEISPATGRLTDQILNVMYVCDADKSPTGLGAKQISNSFVKGTVIGNTAAVFVTDRERASSELTFTAPGIGEVNCYVSGVKAGTWTVTADGSTFTATATEEGGLLVFRAPAGKKIDLSPQS